MAWTQLLASGRYKGIYRDSTGKCRSAGVFEQKAEALREAGAAEKNSRQPGAIDVDGGKIQWGAWFELWHSSRSLAYSTDMTYRSTAGNHVMPRWETVRLCDMAHMDISRWVKDLEKGKKPTSVWNIRNALMLVKSSLNAAVFAKRLTINPATHVPYPDLPVGLERYLTPDEVETICFYMDGLNSLIVWFNVSTGTRFGELAGLHWSRLNLERGTVQLVEMWDQKARVINPLPKDNEQRSVPLPADLVALLAHYRDVSAPARQATCGIQHMSGRCTGDLVFRGKRGAPISSSDWGAGPWRRALKLAGIEGRVRPHDMRHTYASWLLQQGVHLAELARMMGHSDWEVTRKYAHLSEQGYETVREALTNHRRVARQVAESNFVALHDASLEPSELVG